MKGPTSCHVDLGGFGALGGGPNWPQISGLVMEMKAYSHTLSH